MGLAQEERLPEIALNIHPHLAFWQVADMPQARLNAEISSQKFGDGAGFGGGFNDDEGFGHILICKFLSEYHEYPNITNTDTDSHKLIESYLFVNLVRYGHQIWS